VETPDANLSSVLRQLSSGPPTVAHPWGDRGLYDYRFDYADLFNERNITYSLSRVALIKPGERGNLPA
jgi:hypothetical protein